MFSKLCGFIAATALVVAPIKPAPGTLHSESVTAGSAQCAALRALHQGCVLVHRWSGANHQSVAAVSAGLSVPPGYWYWSWYDQECNGLPPVCGVWSLTSTEDGIANGTSILEWNHGCTPGGFLTSVSWCGYLYNGGANVGNGCCEMQFGLNGEYCIASRWGGGCISHGMRRWMWADGRPGTFSAW